MVPGLVAVHLQLHGIWSSTSHSMAPYCLCRSGGFKSSTQPPPACDLRPPVASAAVGSRVKYLLDTPEVIWGCLDVGDFLEAAHRYLRAEQVHQALEGPGRDEVAARFPLLQQQWPAVQMFR